MKKQSITLYFLFILLSAQLAGQNNDLLHQKVPVASGTYTLEELLRTISSLHEVNLTYNSKDIPLKQRLVISKNNPELQEVLDQIVSETTIEYQLLGKYIILKKKKLSSSYIISGQVTDLTSGAPMIGVNVYIKENLTGTVTDDRGNYTFSAPPGNYTLVFSFLGYGKKEIPVHVYANRTVNMPMEQTKTAIQEIQINGQRKFFGNMEYGRDIPTIDAKTIEKLNDNNASDILHARVSGVWATKTSGAPGDHEKIRIRGQSSFFSSVEPLYVVDGVPVPIVNLSSLGIADLNIHDIENITVLKDASSTALYGFQGGNGVVLIDTKQGGANKINFMVKTGVKWFNNFYDLMSAQGQKAAFDSAFKTMGVNVRIDYPAYSDTLCNTDWQKEIFKPGLIQEYQLSGSGSKNKFKYYLSANYTKQNGIIERASYERYTVSARFSRVFRQKLALGVSYRGSVQNNLNNQDAYEGNRIIFEGITKSPSLECTPDSMLINYIPYPKVKSRIFYDYLPSYDTESVQYIIDNNNRRLGIISNSSSFFARLQLSDHLSMDAIESFMYRRSIFNSDFSDYSYTYLTAVQIDIGQFKAKMRSTEDVILFNHQVNLSYTNTFGKHEIGMVLANRLYQDNLWWQVDSMNNRLPEHYYLKNSMASYGPKGSVLRKLGSWIANLSYNYRKTYFLSAVANVSHVKEGLHSNYFSLFPSIAASWDLAQEKPLQGFGWLDHFNVYSNWGRSGNYPLNGLANDLYEQTPYTYGDSTVVNPSVLQLANHHFRHENTVELDFGIKSAFLKNRLDISIAWYFKDISNLIIQRNIPYYYGGGKQYYNIGEIKVHGIDMGIEATPVETKDFFWDVEFNFSSSHQVVTKLLEGIPIIFDNADILIPKFIIREGDPIGNIYGYKNLGKWTAADNAAKNKLYRLDGRMKYLNADTTINNLTPADKVVLGNSIPDFNWNLTNSFGYKNFTLDFTWYAVWGVQKFNATRAATMMAGLNRDIYPYITDSLYTIRGSVFYQSSVFVENASFIRLKNITLTYMPKKTFIGKTQWKFSISLENMITLTKYKGYDPEATIYTDNNFSDNAIDRGAYPNPRGFYVSTGLTF